MITNHEDVFGKNSHNAGAENLVERGAAHEEAKKKTNPYQNENFANGRGDDPIARGAESSASIIMNG